MFIKRSVNRKDKQENTNRIPKIIEIITSSDRGIIEIAFVISV